jgi:FMN reductase
VKRPRIVIVLGSTAAGGRLGTLADVAEAAAVAAGADVSRCDLSVRRLPVMCTEEASQGDLPDVQALRAEAAEADGFILLTPEYHGSMSGALKNWFDYLYPELAGKFAGVIAVTGGGGGDMSITAVKTSFAWCHGFTLPFHAAGKPADFDGDTLTSDKLRDRVQRIGHDVVRYSAVIRATFEDAREAGSDVTSGVAGLH